VAQAPRHADRRAAYEDGAEAGGDVGELADEDVLADADEEVDADADAEADVDADGVVDVVDVAVGVVGVTEWGAAGEE
jgi:hypothetical protein